MEDSKKRNRYMKGHGEAFEDRNIATDRWRGRVLPETNEPEVGAGFSYDAVKLNYMQSPRSHEGTLGTSTELPPCIMHRYFATVDATSTSALLFSLCHHREFARRKLRIRSKLTKEGCLFDEGCVCVCVLSLLYSGKDRV